MIRITDILPENCVCVPLEATEKIAAITALIDLLDAGGRLNNRDDVLGAVLAREKIRSTGIGDGLAVPHGKSHGCRGLSMALGMPTSPIDFGSLDGKPCRLVVLLASPVDATGPHIQALARVSRIWLQESFRSAVDAATSAEALYEAVRQHQG